jgi:hypothetical protein
MSLSVLTTARTLNLILKFLNPLNAKLNPICPLLALLGAHHILHFSRIRINIYWVDYVISIIIIYLSWSWATCWPVPVSRIQKSLQRSAMIPSASWGIVSHYTG